MTKNTKYIYEDSSKATAAALTKLNLERTDLERVLIAELITTPSCIPIMFQMLTSSAFDDTFAKHFDTLVKMFEEGDTIDYITTLSRGIPIEIFTDGVREDKGFTAIERDIISHASTLMDLTRRIDTISAMSSALLEACSTSGDCSTILSATRERLRTLEEGGSQASFVTSISDELSIMQKSLRDQLDGKRPDCRTTTSFPTIDELMFGGFNAGELIILAARPGVGKTSIMLQMAKASALINKAAFVVSLEMTKRELVRKMIFATGHITPFNISCGNFTMDQFELANAELGMSPIYFADRISTMEQIVANIRILHARGKCDIAFIDYLGLIAPEGSGNNFNLAQDIGNRTRRFKQLAIEMGIPIVLLAQLNRESAKGGAHRSPQLTDLRDSGSIEQDADTVIMLEKLMDEDNRIDLHVRKYRHGKTTTIPLEVNKTYTIFREVTALYTEE